MAEGREGFRFMQPAKNPDGTLRKIEPKPEKISTKLDTFDSNFESLFTNPVKTIRRWYTTLKTPRATPAMKAEIAGKIHPGTDDVFVDVPEQPFDWKRDDKEVASNPIVTPVTELANTHTMGELVDVMKMRRPAIPTDGGDPVEQPKRTQLDPGGVPAPRWNKDVTDLFAPTPPRSQEEEGALERSRGHHPSGGGAVEQQSTTPQLKIVTDPKPDQPPTPPTPPEGPSAA